MHRDSSLIKVPEVLAELQCSRTTLTGMILDGRIRCVRIGKRGMRFDREEIARFKRGEPIQSTEVAA